MTWFRRSRGQQDDSKKALRESAQSLRKVQSRGAEVSEVSKNLRMIRERNHFAEQLHTIITGGTGGKHV